METASIVFSSDTLENLEPEHQASRLLTSRPFGPVNAEATRRAPNDNRTEREVPRDCLDPPSSRPLSRQADFFQQAS
jgi:hypothetical protein